MAFQVMSGKYKKIPPPKKNGRATNDGRPSFDGVGEEYVNSVRRLSLVSFFARVRSIKKKCGPFLFFRLGFVFSSETNKKRGTKRSASAKGNKRRAESTNGGVFFSSRSSALWKRIENLMETVEKRFH